MVNPHSNTFERFVEEVMEGLSDDITAGDAVTWDVVVCNGWHYCDLN